jgi:hypothetical protein
MGQVFSESTDERVGALRDQGRGLARSVGKREGRRGRRCKRLSGNTIRRKRKKEKEKGKTNRKCAPFPLGDIRGDFRSDSFALFPFALFS